MASSRPRRLALLAVGAAAAVVVLAVGGTFIYFHFISGPTPAPLSLKTSGSPGTGTSSAPGSSSLAGSWNISRGSVVGYRVQEVLFGQNHTAVGRTGAITGHITISGTTVTSGAFTVRMATITSDASERDAQFRGRIMDTSAYPTGTLTLARPIALAPVPAVGAVRSYTASADLTLHGHTRQVTFALTAERTASGIEISGSIPVLFADWDIPNPSFTGFVTTQNHGILEFLLRFGRS
jgi:polyisoprenoid-binding protein YceI